MDRVLQGQGVEDEQQVVSVAQLTQRAHDSRTIEMHTSRALDDRLEDHCRQLVCVPSFLSCDGGELMERQREDAFVSQASCFMEHLLVRFPAALVVWAIFSYRPSCLSGLLLGLASGRRDSLRRVPRSNPYNRHRFGPLPVPPGLAILKEPSAL